ncbi:MAG TPA: MBL fold metallo-hydrolase [Candidatus Binatia bacterium]|nr:MBL fold metallo-hydrolase [Candidatus Binatia bacterium]
MILKQFYLESLGHASYLVGSEETGQALILDPRRDVDIYFAEARQRELRIRYVADTHQHNDYVSGICEFSSRSQVQLLSGARAQLGYTTRRLNDREQFAMGEVIVEAIHTPGHTPEHVGFLLTDRSRGDEPCTFLSGGSLLVGDVARPDLLGGREETQQHASELCRTLQEKILKFPDYVEVYPTHVSGSLCGGSIGSRLSTTVGYERRMNKLLAALSSEVDFVANCLNLENLPAVPPYWERMRKLNQQGPSPLGSLGEPPALTTGDFERLANQGAIILDCRSPEAFTAHIPGAINVGLGSSFPTWAGTALPDGKSIILVLDHSRDLWEACWQLLRIGYDLPKGWLSGGMMAWRTAAKPIETLPQWTVWQLHELLEKNPEAIVLDVRQPAEWNAGHIKGALHVTGAELPSRIDDIPRDRLIASICGSGYRSSVSASLLKKHGHRRVVNVLGGMTAWKAAGLPLSQ